MTVLLRRTLGAAVEVEISLDEDLWSTVADSGQVESVLLNLALNARDAMPGGGSLRITTANAVVDAEPDTGRTKMEPGDYVVLGITDSGTGIPPEVADAMLGDLGYRRDRRRGRQDRPRNPEEVSGGGAIAIRC